MSDSVYAHISSGWVFFSKRDILSGWIQATLKKRVVENVPLPRLENWWLAYQWGQEISIFAINFRDMVSIWTLYNL